VNISRKVHIWSLLAAEAGRRGQPVSIAVACDAALQVLAVDGATVAAVGPGDVQVSIFATSTLGRQLEDLESSLGEGPGLQAYAEGSPILVSDLACYDTHWPLFGSEALQLGVRGLFAFPLRSGTTPIGVFEVHRKDATALTSDQLGDALLLADIMSMLLLGPDTRDGELFVWDALFSDDHTEVYQATGMVSVHLEVSLPDALARLRGHAFAHGQSISAVAREIVQGRLRLDQGDSDD
jgi:GAF domain